MFTQSQLAVIQYCAEEVKRQMDGPVEVYYMLNAWEYAHSQHDETHHRYHDQAPDIFKTKPLTLNFIETIGKLVEPNDNANGFRTIRIGVGNGFQWIEKAPPDRVIPQLEALLYSYYNGLLFKDDPDAYEMGYLNHNKLSQTAEDEFYFKFEEIHPFKDGNGRTGKILYNYLCGTLDAPIMPPNFWGSSNP